MSQYTGSYIPQDGSSAAEPSTADAARDEAGDVAQHVREAGGQVAQTAADQARQVAAETGRQARDLFGEAQGQARDQASAQQQKAAQQLRAVADELHEMAAKGGQSGLATEVARQAADRLHTAASWLDQRQPSDLLDNVRDFARRRPGTFLAGAAVAGLVAGRLTRGLTGGSGSPAGPQGSTADPGGPFDMATSDPAIPTAPTYPADTTYPAEPAYPAETAYPADTTYPAEPGIPSRDGILGGVCVPDRDGAA